MSRSAVSSILRGVAVAIAATTFGTSCTRVETRPTESAHAPALPAEVVSEERLDALLTPANSFLMDVGGDVVIRVPKMLYPSLDLTHVRQPIRSNRISMTFWYPDMTLAGWVVPRRSAQEYKPSSDRYSVQILWMFYVPRDSDTFVRGSVQPHPYGPEPRPPRVELNRYCYEFASGRCNLPMWRIPSGMPGIDVLKSEDWIQSHPEAATHHMEEGGVYVAQSSLPYELFMDCDRFGSLRCQAYVYSKRHQLQYRMIFAPEAVGRTDDVIQTIDKLLDAWTSR